MGKIKIVKLVCSNCGKSLNTQDTLIDGHETIKVIAQFQNQKTSLNLSAIWGNFESVSQIEIPCETVVEFLCPHCQIQIPKFHKKCGSCNSPIAEFKSIGEHDTFGSIMVCTKKGCRNHKTNKIIPVDTPASP